MIKFMDKKILTEKCLKYFFNYATISMFLFFSPVFDGIYDFCSMYTGATMEGCVKLNNRVSFPIFYSVNLNAYIFITPIFSVLLTRILG